MKGTGLLASPFTVTTTFPLTDPVGTKAVMLVLLQLDAVPDAVPLNDTVLVPCVDPKFVPLIVMAVPAAPVEGLKLVMFGRRIV